MQHPAWGAGRRRGAGKDRAVSRADRPWSAPGTAPPGLGAGGQRPSPRGAWYPLRSRLFSVQIKHRSSAALLNVNLSY